MLPTQYNFCAHTPLKDDGEREEGGKQAKIDRANSA